MKYLVLFQFFLCLLFLILGIFANNLWLIIAGSLGLIIFLIQKFMAKKNCR